MGGAGVVGEPPLHRSQPSIGLHPHHRPEDHVDQHDEKEPEREIANCKKRTPNGEWSVPEHVHQVYEHGEGDEEESSGLDQESQSTKHARKKQPETATLASE